LIEDYGAEPSRVQCVYSGANTADSRKLRPRAEFGKRILFVGYQWERKGGPVLMKAFDRVVEAIPDAELWVVGCAPEVKDPRCKVFGKLSLEDTAKRFEAADLFCLPSYKDPAAIVLGEAAAYGLPIVATDVGGSADRVLDGKTGYLVKAGDSEALAKQLIALLGDAEMCKSFSRNAVQLAKERFSWNVVATKLVGGIKEGLASSHRAENLD
jgi:glycosyltransferase involved in cell wall biosynthesis